MTHPNRVRLSKLSLGLMVALAAAPVFAQSNSAGVGGQVVGTDGQPVAGAEVTITHIESGTVSRATTDASGRYAARGLRVGGPYTITVNKAGTGSDTEENVYLSLNQTGTVNAQLKNDVATLGTVVAVGSSGTSVFSATKMGSGTSVDQQTIQALPSMNGNIMDFARLDPRVTFVDRASNTISAGGQNPRYNQIRVDGIGANDTFGTETGGFQFKRQPVSLAAIEALDISLSNYDVTIAGAAGAVINAVTKSGGNEFHGSLYGNLRDGKWFGDNPPPLLPSPTFNPNFLAYEKEQTYGATFGGPIVKDKLFFFANYEKYEQFSPGVDLSSSPLGKANRQFTEADVAAVQQAAQAYGFNAGGFEASDSNTTLEEYALKLDWNINENHRASLRYSKLEQSKVRPEGTTTTLLALDSSWFLHNKTIDSYVGQVFSDWTDNFSTEFKVSYRDYAAERVVPTNAPEIRILFGGTEAAPTGDTIRLGTEISSQGNLLLTKTWNYFGTGNLTLGDHDVKFGFDYIDNDIYNFFGQRSMGAYTFFGVNNFKLGRYSSYQYLAEVSPGSIAADYKNSNLGLFVQDTWYVNSNLTLVFGLRGDRPSVSPDPAYNAQAETDWGYNNSQIFDGNFILQPRFGFNYTFDWQRPTQLRGGVGLFQGDTPQVWVGNSFNTNGLNSYSIVRNSYDPSLPFSADGFNQPVPPGGATSGLRNVNFVAHDFELPSVWKANVAFEHELPWYGVVASTELLLTDVRNGLYYRNLNLGPGFLGPDGRALYWNPARTGRGWASADARFGRKSAYDQVYLAENTNKGKSQQFTVSLNKPWTKDSDWSWSLGYTYTHATDVGPITSSTASSNWGLQYSFNNGEEVSANSRYAIKDRFSGSLDWKHKFFGDYETHAGLVYEGRSGRPFSYVFAGDANGDTRSFNDLFYVPSGPGDVLFGTLSGTGTFTPNPTAEAAFWQWLAGKPELAGYRGTYARANAFRGDWINVFDVRLSQELPGFFKGHKSELWVDIQNVGNMLNKKWGHIYDFGFNANNGVAGLQGIYNGKYVYNYTSAQLPSPANADGDGVNQGVSQWSVQVGLKYEF